MSPPKARPPTPAPAHWPAWAREDYEERAAIKEHSGRLPRDVAEREARELVQRKVDALQGTLPFAKVVA